MTFHLNICTAEMQNLCKDLRYDYVNKDTRKLKFLVWITVGSEIRLGKGLKLILGWTLGLHYDLNLPVSIFPT